MIYSDIEKDMAGSCAKTSNVTDVVLDSLEGFIPMFPFLSKRCDVTDTFAATYINDMVIVVVRRGLELQLSHLSHRSRGKTYRV